MPSSFSTHSERNNTSNPHNLYVVFSQVRYMRFYYDCLLSFDDHNRFYDVFCVQGRVLTIWSISGKYYILKQYYGVWIRHKSTSNENYFWYCVQCANMFHFLFVFISLNIYIYIYYPCHRFLHLSERNM